VAALRATLLKQQAAPADEHLDATSVAVIKVLRDVLGLDADVEIPLDAELFELGANSIKIGQIVARVRQACAVDVNMADVFKNPTAGNLCSLVKSYHAEKGEQLYVFAVLCQPCTWLSQCGVACQR
jgi:acyl carrier protein